MKFFSLSGPLFITFSRNPQLKDALIGIIRSEVESVLAPVGEERDELDARIHMMSLLICLTESETNPKFERQAQMLEVLGSTTPGLIGRNEHIIRQSVAGKPFHFTSMFDVINTDETLNTFYSYDSYDLNKINSASWMFRAGFIHEFYQQQDQRVSMNLVPVLGTHDKMFGSPYGWFNHAPVDDTSREILTVVFGLGVTQQQSQLFADRLLALKERQEKEAKTITKSIGIMTGYPSVYSNNLCSRPLLVCEASTDAKITNQLLF